MRTTIKDIASALGVSINTVSKALNGKPQVSEETKARVLEAAQKLAYTPNRSAMSLSRREVRVAAVYPLEPTQFYGYVIAGVRAEERALADERCAVAHFPYPSLETPGALRERLEEVRAGGFDALMLTCGHRFDVYRDALTAIGEAGVPILYNGIFGQEVPGLVGGVRMNGRMAGRMAAQFISVASGRARGVKAALLVGEKNLLVHSDCVAGFEAIAPSLGVEVAGVFEAFEDPEMVVSILRKVTGRFPDLGGIYISSYISPVVCDYLTERGLKSGVAVVGHDLYPALNRHLRDGSLDAAIFQNQYEFGRQCLRLTFEYLTGLRQRAECLKLINPQLVLSGMLEYFPTYDRPAE